LKSIDIFESKISIMHPIVSKLYTFLGDLKLKESLRIFLTAFGIYIAWIIIHYGASHFYIYFCVPASILGFLASPFIATSQHCQALRWVIHQGGNSINAMWLIFGTWIAKYLVPISRET
jgi:hypothetical protein